MQMPVNFKIQVLTLHFHWESSKTATCINWFTPGLQEQRCYKSVPWIFCVVLKSGTANTIHLMSLSFHRFFEKKASTSMCWNLALVLTDAFQEHPCSEDLWTVRKTTLGADHIPGARGSPEDLQGLCDYIFLWLYASQHPPREMSLQHGEMSHLSQSNFRLNHKLR